MSRFLLVVSILAGMMLSVTGPAAAQETANDVNVAAIAAIVLGADPEALFTGLETPPGDAELPDGFINPPAEGSVSAGLVDQLTGTTEALVDLEGTIGSVSHGYDTNPEIVPGVLSAGAITYIVADRAITSGDLDLIEERARQDVAVGAPAAGASTPEVESEGSVQRLELNGGDAVLVTVAANLGLINGVVQIVAVPVGNTMVIGTVLVADQGEIDAATVLPFTENLTLAGVAHLGTVAEGAQ